MDLKEIMRGVTFHRDENLLVGMETLDDAGVYQICEDLALVQTVDYITPVVDDPYLFGQVAAANALSDVYAMGARPLTVLNLCNFPDKRVELKVLQEIVRGGADKIKEAGAVVVGGHTVKDEELKYGLSVTGVIHPDRIVRNCTAKPGDKLILTKPVGTGVLITGYKRMLIPEEVMVVAANIMAELNRVACEAMLAVGVNAATDITGFGLGGHTLEMANGSGVGIRLAISAIPHFPESMEMIRQGVKTGMTGSNKELVKEQIDFEAGISPEEKMLLYDPQTSGGLLIAVTSEKADRLIGLMKEQGLAHAAIIGETFAAATPRLVVRREL